MRVDSGSDFILNLYACAGSKHKTTRKWNVVYSYCFEEHHDPLDYLSLDNATGYIYNESGVVRRPLLLHSNGNHERFADARVRLHDLEARATFQQAAAYPVLLIDADAQSTGGACTFGNLSSLSFMSHRGGRV